jgi:hypothetical protein
MESNRGATTFSKCAGRDGDRQISMGMDVLDTRARGVEQMIDAQRHDRGRVVRQVLLVPAVVMALMTAAAPAGASRVTGPTGIANSARTAVVAAAVADPLGRKVG